VSDFDLYTGSQLLGMKSEEDKFLIEHILWEKDVVFLIGDAKAGKSILAMQMACALTCGEAFLGNFEVFNSLNVLYIQMEGTLHETVNRLKEMTCDQGVLWNPEKFFLFYCKNLPLDTTEGFDLFRETLKKIPKPDVIFLDPLYMAMQGDLIDNQHARAMIKNLRYIKDAGDCSLIILHHEHRPSKDREGRFLPEPGSESIFGSFVWRAFANHIIVLKKSKEGHRRISCDTQRSGKVLENIEIEMVQPHPLYYKIKGEIQRPYIKEILGLVQGADQIKGITIEQLVKKSGLSKAAVYISVSILQREKRIQKVDCSRRPAHYIQTIMAGVN